MNIAPAANQTAGIGDTAPVPPWLEPGSPDWHYRQADQILEQLDADGADPWSSVGQLVKAHVHALLALFPTRAIPDAPPGREMPADSIEAQIIAEQQESVNEKESR